MDSAAGWIGGRKAAALVTAIKQPFGFTNWKSQAAAKGMGAPLSHPLVPIQG